MKHLLFWVCVMCIFIIAPNWWGEILIWWGERMVQFLVRHLSLHLRLHTVCGGWGSSSSYACYHGNTSCQWWARESDGLTCFPSLFWKKNQVWLFTVEERSQPSMIYWHTFELTDGRYCCTFNFKIIIHIRFTLSVPDVCRCHRYFPVIARDTFPVHGQFVGDLQRFAVRI